MEPNNGQKVEKMPRLPASAKIVKRPILRPAIPSPYAGRKEEKIVYVSSKMPFMAAVSRVKYLLKQVKKREMQAVLDAQRTRGATHTSSSEQLAEPVILKGTGKAIQKTLSLAMFFQKQQEYAVKITTSSVDAIDDIEVGDDDNVEQDDEDLPESRVRHTSVVEVAVTARY